MCQGRSSPDAGAGFVIGFLGIGLVFGGVIDIESGVAFLTPVADLLYSLGLVIVIGVAARAGVPIRYSLMAGGNWNRSLLQVSTTRDPHGFRHWIWAQT